MGTDRGLKLGSIEGIVDCRGFAKTPYKCGDADAADKLLPKEMCCACGGGMRELAVSCVDFEPGEGDRFGYDCTYYKRYPFDCGWFDDTSFSAKQMCCACGGGATDQKASSVKIFNE